MNSSLDPRNNLWVRNALWIVGGLVLLKVLRRNRSLANTGPGSEIGVGAGSVQQP